MWKNIFKISGITHYVYGVVIVAMLSAAWYFVDDYVYAPKRLNITLSKTISDMNDAAIDEKIRTDAKTDSINAELTKAIDDLNTTYEDGRKQGEADAVFKKCINLDLFST